jgi:hypothetical protein
MPIESCVTRLVKCDLSQVSQATKDDMLRIAVWETIFGGAGNECGAAMIAELLDAGAVWTGPRAS